MPFRDDGSFILFERTDAERIAFLQNQVAALLDRASRAEADAIAAHELIETQSEIIAELQKLIEKLCADAFDGLTHQTEMKR